VSYPIVVVKQPNRRALYLSLRETIELGRECDGVLLADPQVSRRHASLGLSGEHVIVEDLGSTNGTFLDGARIASPVALRPGSQVRLGETRVELLVEAADARTTVGTDALDAGARSTVLAGASAPAGGAATAPSPPAPAAPGAVRAAAGGPASLRETSIDVVAKSFNSGPKDQLRSIEQDQGTITIVFSDIESSTERATAMGDDAWMKVLGAHNSIIRENLKRYGGTEVKNQGDGFMLTFPGARRALRCMIDVQRELSEYMEQHPERGVRIRIGVHTGEVMVEQGDIFGRHVMQAARVANLAHGGEILVSSLVKEIASARGDLKFGEGRTVALKGIEGEHTVYPLLWEEFAPSD
jgi:class 3 adenylate cyclase